MSHPDKYLIADDIRPAWLCYPPELIELLLAGRVDLTPWHLLEAEYAVPQIAALAQRYGRELVPFACRQNNDDLACFEEGCGDEVKVIHNFASRGWENEDCYPGFAGWLAAVEEEMPEWQAE